jgi:hypothetical protein
MVARILFSILLLFSVLFLPFWVSIILGLIGIGYFPLYWEATALFLLSDLLYATPETKFLGIYFAALIIFILVLILAESLKRKIRLYP